MAVDYSSFLRLRVGQVSLRILPFLLSITAMTAMGDEKLARDLLSISRALKTDSQNMALHRSSAQKLTELVSGRCDDVSASLRYLIAPTHDDDFNDSKSRALFLRVVAEYRPDSASCLGPFVEIHWDTIASAVGNRDEVAETTAEWIALLRPRVPATLLAKALSLKETTGLPKSGFFLRMVTPWANENESAEALVVSALNGSSKLATANEAIEAYHSSIAVAGVRSLKPALRVALSRKLSQSLPSLIMSRLLDIVSMDREGWKTYGPALTQLTVDYPPIHPIHRRASQLLEAQRLSEAQKGP